MRAMDEVRRSYFGISRLTLAIDAASRRRVVWTSLAPMVVVAALLTEVSLSLTFDPGELYGAPGGGAPVFWRRLYAVSSDAQSFSPLAVALLVAAGIPKWGRAEGSWMFLIGAVLAVFAVALGATSAMLYATFDFQEAYADLRAETWAHMAYLLGFIAIGYFFIAYRAGLARQPARRYRRRR